MDKPQAQLEHHERMDPEVSDLKNTDDLHDAYVPDTEEERKLVRKIDLYLLPTIWLMYLLSYMDRTK